MSGTQHDRWVCPGCKDEWRGDEPPRHCPVDGTPRSEYIPADEWDGEDQGLTAEEMMEDEISASEVFGTDE